jgi:hypothetical protein
MKIIATRLLLMASSAAIVTVASSTPSAKPTAPMDRAASVLARGQRRLADRLCHDVERHAGLPARFDSIADRAAGDLDAIDDF